MHSVNDLSVEFDRVSAVVGSGDPNVDGLMGAILSDLRNLQKFINPSPQLIERAWSALQAVVEAWESAKAVLTRRKQEELSRAKEMSDAEAERIRVETEKEVKRAKLALEAVIEFLNKMTAKPCPKPSKIEAKPGVI